MIHNTKNVITSYSIHYTKLYEADRRPEGLVVGFEHCELQAAIKTFLDDVITSYSIHYTKLYDLRTNIENGHISTSICHMGNISHRIGKKAIICLREPSLGPVFGMKGGAAGGGYAQVV